MKISGKKVDAPNVEKVYIPRGDDGMSGFLFSCQPVTNMEEFEKRFPEPQPPKRVYRGEKTPKPVLNDENYLKEKAEHDKLRYYYFILKSLEATEDLEWETVVKEDASTWGNFQSELEESGFLPAEISRIINGVLKANSLDEEHIKTATNNFLAGLQVGNDQ